MYPDIPIHTIFCIVSENENGIYYDFFSLVCFFGHVSVWIWEL